MSDNPFRKQAEELIENVADLQKRVLLKHTTGLLAAIYEEREKWKHRAESSERALTAERERADRNQEDAERLCSLLDATEINGDHFTWRRRDRKPVDALRNEMDAIFGIDAARRK